MVELVDSVDLGSSVLDVQVRVLLPAPYRVVITDLSYDYPIFLSGGLCSLTVRYKLLIYSLTDVLTIGSPVPGNIQIAHKTVIDVDPLAAVMPGPFGLMDDNVVDEFMKHTFH